MVHIAVYHRDSQMNANIQKYLGAAHDNAGIAWYMRAVLKSSKRLSIAPTASIRFGYTMVLCMFDLHF